MLRFIDNDGVSLALESHGRGRRRVLFVHGWISSRRIWREAIALLDPERWSAHALDLRGCGRSDRPADGHDLRGYASDVACALATIAEPTIVVGHSMGAKVALFAALRGLAMAQGLVLVAPGSPAGIPPSPDHRSFTEAAFGNRRRIARFVLSATARRPDPQIAERLTTDALIAQREAWFEWYGGGREVDFADELGALAVPVAVVLGARDMLASPARIDADLCTRLPRPPQTVVVPDVAHNVPVEAPAAIVALLESFAASLDPRA